MTLRFSELRLAWDDVRLFLEIARAGTLTAAATRLKLSQPTAGRRLRALEAAIGGPLFQRTSKGFQLTDEGEAMLAHAEHMAEEATALERKLVGGARGLEGSIRVSASDWVSARILAAPVAAFTVANPGLTVEIVSDSRMVDLRHRDADLAIRFLPFVGTDIVHRRLARIRYGLYAAPDYLGRCGDPLASTDGAGHALVTLDSALDSLEDAVWLRSRWPMAGLGFRSNNREAQGIACAAGAGIAVLPRVIGDQLGIVRLGGEEPPPRDLWLGYHEDLRRLRRLRLLVEHLTASLSPDS